MVILLVPIAMLVLRPKRADECDRADRSNHPTLSQARDQLRDVGEPRWALSSVVRSTGFLTISIPFALALTAQVGLLTHQLAYLSPIIGAVSAGWAVSLTAAAALLGRTVTGLFVDRIDRRAAACVNFLVQMTGVATLAASRNAPTLYLGCILFGLGVGNTTSLPSLIVHQEFPSRFFARIVSLVVAINQFTFAFGPSLLGYLHHLTDGYTASLVLCLLFEAAAAALVIVPILSRMARRRTSSSARATRR